MPGRHRFRSIVTFREVLSRSTQRPVIPTPGCTIGFADGPTGIGHRVTEQAFAEGTRTGDGYLALCGARVLPESLTAPARYHCPACERSA